MQQQGVNVLPVNFYSSTPSIAEIRDSFEYKEPTPTFIQNFLTVCRLDSVLHELLLFSGELDAPMDDDNEQPSGFFWNNSQFAYSDAAAYYAFIRLIQPRKIVEVGAGFSTLAASAAIEANGCGVNRTRGTSSEVFRMSATSSKSQSSHSTPDGSTMHLPTLSDNDVLFIDSTHAVKIGSDCLHLYLRVLPALTRKLFVHVHDVFCLKRCPGNGH